MFKFSCADFTFPVLERSAALRLVKLLGFDHVDIGLFARSTHFSPIDLHSSPRSYTEQVLQDLDAAELRASDVFLQVGVDPPEFAANDPSQAVRTRNSDVFKAALEFCVALGSKHLTGLPGVFHGGVARDRDLDLAAEVAAWRATECASAGIQYAIEPHVGSICADVASTQAFLGAVEGLTLTLDYGHFVMTGESSAHVHALLPFASHVHVRGGAPDRLQTTVGENTIDFPGMLAGLQRLDYEGFLALEYVWIDWKGCNRTDNVSETVLLRRALESTISEITKKEAASLSSVVIAS
jgi:sugar phosphate isomerase/epimerase